jgi:hypothetical protein
VVEAQEAQKDTFHSPIMLLRNALPGSHRTQGPDVDGGVRAKMALESFGLRFTRVGVVMIQTT